MFKGCFLNEGKSFELQIKSEKESSKKKKWESKYYVIEKQSWMEKMWWVSTICKTKFVYISNKELKPRPASGFKTDK